MMLEQQARTIVQLSNKAKSVRKFIKYIQKHNKSFDKITVTSHDTTHKIDNDIMIGYLLQLRKRLNQEIEEAKEGRWYKAKKFLKRLTKP